MPWAWRWAAAVARGGLSINRRVAAYLDEMEFRYNNRMNSYLFRDTLLKLIGAEN